MKNEVLNKIKPSLQALSDQIESLIASYKATLPKGVDLYIAQPSEVGHVNCIKGKYLAYIMTVNVGDFEEYCRDIPT